MFVIINHDIFV